MTITEFLLARIAEDEEAARAATSGTWLAATFYPTRTEVLAAASSNDAGIVARTPVKSDADGEHIARHDPARVLAECKAKREIVESFRIADEQWRGIAAISGHPDATTAAFEARAIFGAQQVGFLAEVYADHPDYREEWRP